MSVLLNKGLINPDYLGWSNWEPLTLKWCKYIRTQWSWLTIISFTLTIQIFFAFFHISMVPKMIGLTSTAVAAARSLSSSAATMSSLALPCVNFAIPSPTSSTRMQRHQQYAIILITLKTWILMNLAGLPRQPSYFFHPFQTYNKSPSKFPVPTGNASQHGRHFQPRPRAQSPNRRLELQQRYLVNFQENEDESMRIRVLYSVI